MRLDIFLLNNGFCVSRNKAQTIIRDGRVSVNGKTVDKPSYEVNNSDDVKIEQSDIVEFVGRGGNKLLHAFENFNFSAEKKTCLDIGASTGGFTECLLLYGARKVYAVDSGTGQLAESLKNDSRVISIEGFNARNLLPDTLDGEFMDVVVMDVSFISQKLLYPAILQVAKSGCDVITLIKPQFEVGRKYISKNGIVKDSKIKAKTVEDIISYASEMGFEYIGHTESPITGGDGNQEFLLHLKVK